MFKAAEFEDEKAHINFAMHYGKMCEQLIYSDSEGSDEKLKERSKGHKRNNTETCGSGATQNTSSSAKA